MTVIPYSRILAVLCVLVCAGCATVSYQGGIAYKVEIDGAGWKVKRAIKESTETCRFVKRPPSTVGQLRNRMDKDKEIIEAILESNGYYDGTVHLYVDETREPVRVEIQVYKGRRYHYRKVRLKFAGTPDKALKRIRLRVRKGQPVEASSALAEEQRIIDEIKQYGYPFPKLARRTVVINRKHRTVDLAWVFDHGRLARFGNVEVEGLTELNDNYVRRQVPWREGEKYDAKAVKDFEHKLLGSGLFSSVRISMDETTDDGSIMPVLIRLNERDKRTIRLGVNYSDIGPGVKGYWEHRNLFGSGEHLETSASWDSVKTTGMGRFTRAGFLDANQYLVLEGEATRDSPDAYDARKGTATAMILRDITSTIQLGAGVGGKYSRVEQLNQDQHFAHVFFPLQATFDTRNDRLNPVRGMQLYGRTAYFNDMLGPQSFQKSQAESRHYMMLWERFRLSSALRLTLGSIDGASANAVPADERFYAGGGGSIRGYEYQKVGPQEDGVPTGGDKLVEFSAEMRLQPGRKLGYAAFIDGGTVYDEKVGNYDRALQYGAGVGIRWFTAIGPLRADFAYPLNPTKDQIARLQFYISLGQAF